VTAVSFNGGSGGGNVSKVVTVHFQWRRWQSFNGGGDGNFNGVGGGHFNGGGGNFDSNHGHFSRHSDGQLCQWWW
jgi:hypothetical protein